MYVVRDSYTAEERTNSTVSILYVLEEKGMDGGCFSIAIGSAGGCDTVTQFV